jgi:LuxR family maltose regulon positive regulatory protein
MVTLNLAMAHYLQGEFEPASHLLTEIIATGQTAALMASTLLAIHFKAQILRARGTLQQALQLCQEGLALVARRAAQFPGDRLSYVAGDLSREEMAYQAAEYLEKGSTWARKGSSLYLDNWQHLWPGCARPEAM